MNLEDIDTAKKLFISGLKAVANNDNEEAANLFKKSLEIIPNRQSTLKNLASVLLKLNKIEEAAKVIDIGIELYPNDISFLLNKSIMLLNDNYLEEALYTINKAINFNNNSHDSYFQRGMILQKLGVIDESIKSFKEVIKISPESHNAYFQLGILYFENREYRISKECYEKVINFAPSNAEAYSNLGMAQLKLKQWDDSISSFNTAIKLSPNYIEAYSNLGSALYELSRFEESLLIFNKLINLKNDYADAFFNKANLLVKLNRNKEALTNYNSAIKLDPNQPEYYNNKAQLLYYDNKYEEALINIELALKLNSNYAEAYNNLGNILIEKNNNKIAIECYDKAIKINGNYDDPYFNKGLLFQNLKIWDQAIKSLEIAYKLNNEHEYLLGTLLFSKMYICDWSNYDNNIDILKQKIYNNLKVTTSFPLLVVLDEPDTHKFVAEMVVNSNYIYKPITPIKKSYTNHKKIKIGYFSSDFGEHPVSYLTVELFETHNKNNFEIIAFFNGEDDGSDIYKRIFLSFDRFINIKNMSDEEVANLSRELEIDIAVDLTGMTQNSRIGIFSYRASPIQISYLGYLGSIGAEYYDYIIADTIIIPESYQKFYSEKIIYLPNYQVNDSKRAQVKQIFKKSDFGIPEDNFIFCCFNNNYKITPKIFVIWMRILSKVPKSILWIFVDNKLAENNLKNEAIKFGLVSRIFFSYRTNRNIYLSKLKIADLFLDTFPYNAGTTASDALWSDLPVLTCMGKSFASRVAASILHSANMSQLIVKSEEEYEELAIKIGLNIIDIQYYKNHLNINKVKMDLFNTLKFSINLEKAYSILFKNSMLNFPNENIYIR